MQRKNIKQSMLHPSTKDRCCTNNHNKIITTCKKTSELHLHQLTPVSYESTPLFSSYQASWEPISQYHINSTSAL